MNALLESFSNLKIALLLLNRLWASYDLGGVSVGRSLRATLIETISYLAPLRYYYHESVFGDHLLEEAKWSKSQRHHIQLRFDFDFELSEISDEHLFKLIMIRLHGWYMENMLVNGNKIKLIEWKIIEAVMDVLNVNELLMTYRAKLLNCTSEQLISEGNERNWKRGNDRDDWV